MPSARDRRRSASIATASAGSISAARMWRYRLSLAAEAPSVRLAAAHVGQIEQQVRQAESALAQTEIRAPVAGIVSSRAVNPGNRVEPGQTLLVISSAESSAAPKPAVESIGKAAASQH